MATVGRPPIIMSGNQELSEYELLAHVFRAFGDPSRLRILELLIADGALTQSELIERVGITQSRASGHLSCLVSCGLIRAEREGRVVRYRLANVRVISLVDTARALLADRRGSLTSLP
jgi:DNA-binding transcriptional ArsR family regulator